MKKAPLKQRDRRTTTAGDVGARSGLRGLRRPAARGVFPRHDARVGARHIRRLGARRVDERLGLRRHRPTLRAHAPGPRPVQDVSKFREKKAGSPLSLVSNSPKPCVSAFAPSSVEYESERILSCLKFENLKTNLNLFATPGAVCCSARTCFWARRSTARSSRAPPSPWYPSSPTPNARSSPRGTTQATTTHTPPSPAAKTSASIAPGHRGAPGQAGSDAKRDASPKNPSCSSPDTGNTHTHTKRYRECPRRSVRYAWPGLELA